MNSRQLFQLKLILSFTGLFLLFQNFAFLSWEQATIRSINQVARKNHAQELLGVKYRGSLAELVESNSNLHHDLFRTVRDRLPAKDKHLAVEVTRELIAQGQKHHFDPIFLLAMIETESRFNTRARGRHGEIGLMQLKPDTAAWIASKANLRFDGPKSLEKPSVNIELGAAYVQLMRGNFPKSAPRYVAAYNMGPANVRKLKSKKTDFEYTSKVLSNYDSFYRTIASEQPTPFTAQNL